MGISPLSLPRASRRFGSVRSPKTALVLPSLLPVATVVTCLLACLGPRLWSAEPLEDRETSSTPFAPWVEANFPFFSSVLDLREVDKDSLPHNITPRGIVIRVAPDHWACFDTELLRISAVWKGPGVTPMALAPVSYQRGAIKTRGGQAVLPQPASTPWLINGMYPGWQRAGLGSKGFSTIDPRTAQPSREEAGRGPLPASHGQFLSIDFTGARCRLVYSVAGSRVTEHLSLSETGGLPALTRHLEMAPCARDRWIILGRGATATAGRLATAIDADPETRPLLAVFAREGITGVRVPSHRTPLRLAITLAPSRSAPPLTPVSFRPMNPHASESPARWPEAALSIVRPASHRQGPFVVDHLGLPLPNVWRRNVRLADVQFFSDGRAAAVTLDGDLWLAEGTHSSAVRWTRFSSGFHEPMSLAIRDEKIFVFDRNGIWEAIDRDGNGEADEHALFSNRFPQSAETREFPNGISLAPDGSFVIAKGGQQASTVNRTNGSVLRVASDGRTYEPVGVGFRQPFIGVDPLSGMVTASDQEGHYIPTTPLHIVKDGAFHGYLSNLLPKEAYPAPIARPLVWLPHSVNPSGTSQVWTHGSRLGPLNASLLHLAFNRPEVFQVLINRRLREPEAAVLSVLRDFDLPALHGAVHPVDGALYLSGFQITAWGTTAERLSGVARIRVEGNANPLPSDIAAFHEGVLLRFAKELDAAAANDMANYAIEQWDYRRTSNYGSAHYRADGTPGQDWITPSSVTLSLDRRALFLGIPQMRPRMQMRVAWSLQATDGLPLSHNAYLTPRALPPFSPEEEGFGAVTIDLRPREHAAGPTPSTEPTSVAEGERLYQLMGCMACHDSGETDQPKVGPSWKGLYGKKRSLARPKGVIEVDEAYLRESILDPAAKLVSGYEKREAGMPVYAGVLTERQIDSLILFIKSLR